MRALTFTHNDHYHTASITGQLQVLPERFGLAGTVELAPKHDSLGADELAERRCDLHGDLDMDNDLPVEQEGRSHVQKDPKQGDS